MVPSPKNTTVHNHLDERSYKVAHCRFESYPDYKVERTVSLRMETTIKRAYVILYFKTPRLREISVCYGV
jgi:hypothetical protein